MASTSTVKSTAYGAEFATTVPQACVQKGAPFNVALSIKKPAKAKGAVLKVTKVVFAVNGKTVKTLKSAPYRARLGVAPTAASGSTIKVRAIAYLMVHGGKGRGKSTTMAVKVC